MTNVRELHEEWSKDPDYRNAYEELGPEFALARALIDGERSGPSTPFDFDRFLDGKKK